MEAQAKLLADLTAAISSMNAKLDDMHPVVLELNQWRPGVEHAVDTLRVEVGDLRARVIDATRPTELVAGTALPPLFLLSADAPSSSCKPALAPKPASTAATNAYIDVCTRASPLDTNGCVVEVAAQACFSPDQDVEVGPEVDLFALTGFIAMASTTCSTVCLPQQQVATPTLVASSPPSMTEYGLNNNGQVHYMMLQSKRAEIHQLITQPGKYLSLFLQPKPPWLFLFTQPYEHVEEKGVQSRREVITLNSKTIFAASESYVHQQIELKPWPDELQHQCTGVVYPWPPLRKFGGYSPLDKSQEIFGDAASLDSQIIGYFVVHGSRPFEKWMYAYPFSPKGTMGLLQISAHWDSWSKMIQSSGNLIVSRVVEISGLHSEVASPYLNRMDISEIYSKCYFKEVRWCRVLAIWVCKSSPLALIYSNIVRIQEGKSRYIFSDASYEVRCHPSYDSGTCYSKQMGLLYSAMELVCAAPSRVFVKLNRFHLQCPEKILAHPACMGPCCSRFSGARVGRFWEGKQLEPNYWVSYMMKHCTDMSYRIQTEHIWLLEEIREGMHKFAFISSERCFFLLDIPHNASELSMCSKDSSVRSSSMMQRDLSIWLSVVFSRPSTLDCTHAWQVSCVTPCMASGATDKCDSSYVMVLGKELQAPWDPGGHAPRVSGDSGLRASRMLRRGECHGPCGPMHLVDWAVVLTDLQATVLIREQGEWMRRAGTRTWTEGPGKGRHGSLFLPDLSLYCIPSSPTRLL